MGDARGVRSRRTEARIFGVLIPHLSLKQATVSSDGASLTQKEGSSRASQSLSRGGGLVPRASWLRCVCAMRSPRSSTDSSPGLLISPLPGSGPGPDQDPTMRRSDIAKELELPVPVFPFHP